MDKISIIDLKIPAKHGVYESEKDKEGLFELDIEMYTDLTIPGNSDQLNETVNYDEVVRVVTNIFKRKDYNLIEAVGQSICKELLIKYPIEKVIFTYKEATVIMANLKTVEVELVREK